MIILAGGLGTRLRSALPDRPKVLAPVGGRVFLDLLLDRLAAFGARRVILALGHLAEQVHRHLVEAGRTDMTVETAVEPAPMGTAGALAHVRGMVRTGTALVMNGDTLVEADLCTFVAAHRAGGAEATILCTRVADAGRFGTVEIGPRGRIAAFREKVERQGAGTINAGVYLMGRGFLERIAGASLERDVFQALPPGTLGAYAGDFPFIDIGTPEDLKRAGILSRVIR